MPSGGFTSGASNPRQVEAHPELPSDLEKATLADERDTVRIGVLDPDLEHVFPARCRVLGDRLVELGSDSAAALLVEHPCARERLRALHEEAGHRRSDCALALPSNPENHLLDLRLPRAQLGQAKAIVWIDGIVDAEEVFQFRVGCRAADVHRPILAADDDVSRRNGHLPLQRHRGLDAVAAGNNGTTTRRS